ncbi:proline iminopeptidase [Folsomia candida]|uniref:Proline iminopeptidase n=1 Tax=Folsomia candida TaxID=158441 RepID=A0A226EUR8_FOLCA|nr:proline iminopeptidase [Folsomia candida]OXA60907.1 Proline iminopeptidase [Folsomia candida]
MNSDADDALYPEIEPFFTGTLPVSDIHTLYYEQCGNKEGIPVVFLHGGPGSSTSGRDRRFFDPKVYHVILFHQRGAGKSTPAFCLEENNTFALVADMEKLREKVGVSSWLLFGGSWGSTLALAYAEKHIDHVLGLIIRGIFTNRKIEQDWFYSETGAGMLYPEEYAKFVELIPLEERGDIVKAYYKRLTAPVGDAQQLKCATAWNIYELTLSSMQLTQEDVDKCQDDNWNLAHARIECHYFVNKGYLEESQLINDAVIIAKSGVPVEIVQGRYDLACPVKTAWDLHKQIPQSILHILPMAGHSSLEHGTGMTRKLVDICDKFKNMLK